MKRATALYLRLWACLLCSVAFLSVTRAGEFPWTLDSLYRPETNSWRRFVAGYALVDRKDECNNDDWNEFLYYHHATCTDTVLDEFLGLHPIFWTQYPLRLGSDLGLFVLKFVFSGGHVAEA